nr:atypical chemokine receptor 4 isoform X3 [Chelonoidis abingdonii]
MCISWIKAILAFAMGLGENTSMDYYEDNGESNFTFDYTQFEMLCEKEETLAQIFCSFQSLLEAKYSQGARNAKREDRETCELYKR